LWVSLSPCRLHVFWPSCSKAYYELASDGKPDTVIILGPNHTGYGSGLAIMNDGSWRTPLGDVEIDSETANKIVDEVGIIDVDNTHTVLSTL
jgi:MEMO1 family protein